MPAPPAAFFDHFLKGEDNGWQQTPRPLNARRS
jgi:hypothetical protein